MRYNSMIKVFVQQSRIDFLRQLGQIGLSKCSTRNMTRRERQNKTATRTHIKILNSEFQNNTLKWVLRYCHNHNVKGKIATPTLPACFKKS